MARASWVSALMAAPASGCGSRRTRPWQGELVCPRYGSRTLVRVALAVEEVTDADLAAIEATTLTGEDLAEDGSRMGVCLPGLDSPENVSPGGESYQRGLIGTLGKMGVVYRGGVVGEM